MANLQFDTIVCEVKVKSQLKLNINFVVVFVLHTFVL